MMEQGDLQIAAQIFASVCSRPRTCRRACRPRALPDCGGRSRNARATLALVPPAKASDPDVLSATAALDLAAQPGRYRRDRPPVAGGRAKPRRPPGPSRSRRRPQCRGPARGGARPPSRHVRRQRDWNDDAARKQLVRFFEAWGPKDELTVAGRKRLSSILFS